jgi:hypothetical protein
MRWVGCSADSRPASPLTHGPVSPRRAGLGVLHDQAEAAPMTAPREPTTTRTWPRRGSAVSRRRRRPDRQGTHQPESRQRRDTGYGEGRSPTLRWRSSLLALRPAWGLAPPTHASLGPEGGDAWGAIVIPAGQLRSAAFSRGRPSIPTSDGRSRPVQVYPTVGLCLRRDQAPSSGDPTARQQSRGGPLTDSGSDHGLGT